MSTVTRTVVFTDLESYTAKVARADREGLRKILIEHEELVTPIIEKHGGRIVKNLGDSFMCLFLSATDALRSALDIQDVVTAEGNISIRLAMTTGDVEEIDGDAFGESVNLAARILSKAPAGEIWFGPGTYICMNAAEIPWESVGRFRLKGIPGEKEVFRAVPSHRCWLPETLIAAVKMGNLVRIACGTRPPILPPDPVVLLEGFTPGSEELSDAMSSLPVLNPASLWLTTYNIAAVDRGAWTESGRGLVIGIPDAVEASIKDAQKVVARTTGSDTIVLDIGMAADMEVVMCGLALPAVPLSDVVASYFYDLLADGRWMNASDRAVLRVEVNATVSVRAMSPGVSIDGRSLASGETLELHHGASIRTPSGFLQFRKVAQGYAGLLLSDTDMRLGIMSGQTAELGREPNHPGLAFPDRRGQDNIRWCSGPRAARARAGGFTLDRALAGRRQASVEMIGDQISVTTLHQRCPTYVVKANSQDMTRVEATSEASMTDVLVVGTTVVGFRHPE